jgi:predicted GNAT family acetyltransferase
LTDAVSQVEVRDNRAGRRYEALVHGDVAGYVRYRREPGRITFIHTTIQPEYKGQGIASSLVRGALDDVRARGDIGVVAVCPFVKGWLGRHPEYRDLLVPGPAEQAGGG